MGEPRERLGRQWLGEGGILVDRNVDAGDIGLRGVDLDRLGQGLYIHSRDVRHDGPVRVEFPRSLLDGGDEFRELGFYLADGHLQLLLFELQHGQIPSETLQHIPLPLQLRSG